jgi:radical SAM protein with 4Fe4S-binding SPASM domain
MSAIEPAHCQEMPYRPRRLLMQWHVTERCNLRCAHCYQEGYFGEELPFESLRRLLRQYTDLLDLWRGQPWCSPMRGHITVTGGEPFVRADFLDLLEVFAANRGQFTFAILTNGSFIDVAVARRLRKLRPAYVQVSIEGSRTTHDRIRGSGNFDLTVTAIERLMRQGIRTIISFSAHRGNFREFPEVCRLGRTLQVSRVWADRVVPLGSGAELREQVLTPEETCEFFHIMREARREAAAPWFHRTEIAMHRALQFLMGGGRPYHCTAGDSLITVQPNGDVFPCRRMPVRVGNLMETALTELYYESDLLCALRDRTRVSQGCEACCFARVCRGGLKCLSYATTGDPFRGDPGCFRASSATISTTRESRRSVEEGPVNRISP